ncbi:acyl-CoA carboxylase subunit epsilon [Krasilnikovia cinnamomea]|uniref:acyl-CoA carboxylase subunit epsilon n=1 Tax=Krasilnikovia cinnamomea TaxID=349313 RepID=UPI00102B9A5C|nr:acyl-CoA carboxylase subunit epsilon [Krasilnikovia cinnamomea]
MDPETKFSVVRGTPTAEEVAALVGALVSRTATSGAPTPPPRMSAWVRSARPAGRPGSWRDSGLPR